MALNLFTDAGNPLLTSILDQEYKLAIGDRAFIGMHPALLSGLIGKLPGTADPDSATGDSYSVSAGIGALATVAEGTDITPTAFAFSKLQATVARVGGGRRVGEMLRIFDGSGALKDPTLYMLDALSLWQNTLMTKIIAAGVTFTNDVATSGVALTLAKLIEARDSLVENDNGMVDTVAILHPRQWAHISQDLGTAGTKSNAVQNSPEAYMAQFAKSNGYKGRYFDIDIFTSNKVPTANVGVDRRGFIFTNRGIAWKTKAIGARASKANSVLIGGGLIEMTSEYNGSTFVESVYYNALLGAAKGEDVAGATITSLA